MGRLDRRTADEEDDRSAQDAAHNCTVSRKRQLQEAETAAARTAAQETLVEEVYGLVEQFLELMAEQDYPGLETVTLPMTRWWWPFPRDTRKAVWKLFHKEGEGTRPYIPGYINEVSEETYSWWEDIYFRTRARGTVSGPSSAVDGPRAKPSRASGTASTPRKSRHA